MCQRLPNFGPNFSAGGACSQTRPSWLHFPTGWLLHILVERPVYGAMEHMTREK